MAKLDQIEIDGTLYEVVPEIGPLFSASTAYQAGKCVIKDAVLYRFKTAHAAGAWVGTDAEAIEVGKELTGLKQDFIANRTGDLRYCPLAYYYNTTGTVDFKSMPRNTYIWETYGAFKAGFEEANIPNLGWADGDTVAVYKIAGHRTAENLCTVIIRNFTKTQELTMLYFGSSSVSKYRWLLPTTDLTKQYLPAEAKAVGDAIALTNTAVNGISVSVNNLIKQTGIIPVTWVNGYAFPTNGQFYPNDAGGIHTDFFKVTAGSTISFTQTGISPSVTHILFYSSNTESSWISSEYITGTSHITIPANATYAIIGIYQSNASLTYDMGDVIVWNGNTPYYDVQFATNEIPIGTHTARYEGFSNYYLYGANKIGSVISDNSGNYDTPPIEISGGVISNLTIKETGGVTEHNAHCIHTDNNNNKNNSLTIDSCIIESNSGHCIGVGTRLNYNLTISNCVIKCTDNDSTGSVCVYVHNSNNGDDSPTGKNAQVKFINCVFISDSDKCLKLQDWHGSTIDAIDFTFINCTFCPKTGQIDDSAFIEYRSYTPEEMDSHVFKNKFTLANCSHGNNVSWLNAV